VDAGAAWPRSTASETIRDLRT